MGAWPRTMALLISDHTTMALLVSDLRTIDPRTMGLLISDLATIGLSISDLTTIALTPGGRRTAGGGCAGGRARAGAGGRDTTIAPWHNGLAHYMRGVDEAFSVVNSNVTVRGRLNPPSMAFIAVVVAAQWAQRPYAVRVRAWSII